MDSFYADINKYEEAKWICTNVLQAGIHSQECLNLVLSTELELMETFMLQN
jgi:hypothetical protein